MGIAAPTIMLMIISIISMDSVPGRDEFTWPDIGVAMIAVIGVALWGCSQGAGPDLSTRLVCMSYSTP